MSPETPAPAPAVILLAIKPEFGNLLLDGTKLYEFRKKPPLALKAGDRILLYFSAPDSVVVGEVEVESVHPETKEFWVREARDLNGVDSEFEPVQAFGLSVRKLELYFGEGSWTGIRVRNPKRWKTPLDVSTFYGSYPQNFVRLPPDTPTYE